MCHPTPYASNRRLNSGLATTTLNDIWVCLACILWLRMEYATHGTPGLVAGGDLLVDWPVPACLTTSEPTRPYASHRATAVSSLITRSGTWASVQRPAPPSSAQRPASPRAALAVRRSAGPVAACSFDQRHSTPTHPNASATCHRHPIAIQNLAIG